MTGLNTSKHQTVEEMFHDRYIPEPNSGCWIWIGCPDQDGYGSFQPNGERWRAHRFSWFLINGPIPNDKMVCHSCDNTACVNPDHLFISDAKGNSDDMHNKGRGLYGEDNPTAKLKNSDIALIIQDPRSYTKIAADYAVSAQTICNVKRGKTYIKVREILE